jgi:hypothetical protein
MERHAGIIQQQNEVAADRFVESNRSKRLEVDEAPVFFDLKIRDREPADGPIVPIESDSVYLDEFARLTSAGFLR